MNTETTTTTGFNTTHQVTVEHKISVSPVVFILAFIVGAGLIGLGILKKLA